jgi:uncharacterized integral membrane protein
MTAAQNHRDISAPNGARTGNNDSSRPTPARSVARRSLAGGLWVAAVVFALVLLMFLIFVLENGQRADVSFFGAHGHLPMGVALLLAAVFGILLVALPGTARIVQLRMLGRRHGSRAATGPLTAPLPLSADHRPVGRRPDSSLRRPPGRQM